MSRIVFRDSYIIVEPTYKDTEIHKHEMFHIFLGDPHMTMDLESSSYSGNIILLKNNIYHKGPDGALKYVLLIDPTSNLAEQIYNLIGSPSQALALNISQNTQFINNSCHDKELAFEIEKELSNIGLEFKNTSKMDIRIGSLITDIRNFKYLGKKVSDIAQSLSYSESWLTHLFKNEAGLSLKSYLLMRQIEYVWKAVYKGEKITSASLDAGFSSPSHFAASCKKLTGISISEAL